MTTQLLTSQVLIALLFILCSFTNAKASVEEQFDINDDLISWDGSDISVAANQSGSSLVFTLSNTGSDMDGYRSYYIIEDDIILLQGNYLLNAANGNSIQINYEGDPGLYTCKVKQHAEYPGEEYATATIELVASNFQDTKTITELNSFVQVVDERVSKEQRGEGMLSINPNPFKNEIIFNLTDLENIDINEDYTIRIFSAQGQQMKELKFITNKIEINTEDLNSGYYFYQVFKDKQVFKTGQIIKLN